MSEDNTFEQMLNETFKPIHVGEVVEGEVIDVKPDEAILNINGKSDGILTRNEYSNEPCDLTEKIHVGDKMEVKIMKVNDGEGQTVLTYKRLAVFIPASLVSDTYEKNLDKYKDQEIEFVVTEFNPRRRRIIGDRKQLLVERKKELQKELFERIHVGDRVEGVVKNVTDFGAFIDLGGADGLLHISEMSWGHVENPKKVFKVGEKVEVMIKNINSESGKIALTRKFPDANPWNDASEKYAVGTRMTDFGAFVELEPGVDALLHVSQISHEHVDKPSDVLKVGQEIEAKIVDFNGEDHKISLSMKALETSAPKSDAEEE